MPRAFNGSASITCSIGGMGGFQFGTMLAIARRADDAAWHGIVTTRQSGAGAYEAYLDIAPSGHASAGAIWSSWGGTDNAATLKFLAADGWCIIACTKATGSATPRYHKCVLSSRVWTHDNSGAAVANATSTPGGTVIFGDVAGDALNGDLAAVALYGRTFSDQEIESLLTWETWLSYGPTGAWLLDQAATAQSLVDWVGTANQSAITGTTVTTASLPGWNQSDGGIWVAEVTAGGAPTTDAPAENAAGTGTAQDAATAVATQAEVSAAAGTAQDPTASAGAQAGNAPVAAAAQDAATAVAVFAECAAATGTANDATVSTVAQTSAPAECATATATATDPAVALGALAESAAAAGTANDATVSTATSTSALAECATATAAANDPVTAVAASAESAAITASALTPAAGVGALAESAAGIGSAQDPLAALAVAVEAALAVVTAYDAVSPILNPVGRLTASTAATTTLEATARRTGGPS